MTFLDQLEIDDIHTFFNPLEFAEKHTINGKEMLVVIDTDELEKRKRGRSSDFTGGVYEGDVLFYVRKATYGKRQDLGTVVTYDGAKYRITDFMEDMGLYTITLVKNLAGRRG